MTSTGRWFLAVTVLVSVTLAVLATFIASLFLGGDDGIDRTRAVLTSLIVGVFVALILLARRQDDFAVEPVEERPSPRDQEFVAEAVETGNDED